MVTELILSFVLLSCVAGMLVGRFLYHVDIKAQHIIYSNIHRKVESIAMDLKKIHGLRKNYIVWRLPGVPQFTWVEVKEFKPDYMILADDTIHHYTFFSGYCMPPLEIVEKMRAKESGIYVTKKGVLQER